MKFQKPTVETALYALALILAIGVRFLYLGAAPLSESEATWAVQAWQLSQAPAAPATIETLDLSEVEGRVMDFDPQPAYLILTAGAFTLFGSTNFLARFWPALAGSLLVLSPLIAGRRWRFIRAAPGIIMAFGLALDPGMVAASRTAGSSMMALGFSGLALAFVATRTPVLAGICAGVALLSGPAMLHGLVVFGLAWAAYRLLKGQQPKFSSHISDPGEDGRPSRWRFGVIFALGGGITALLLGTYFSIYPRGLSLSISTIPAYLEGWIGASTIPVTRLLVALVVYQPLAVIFGLAALGGAWVNPDWRQGENRAGRILSFGLIAAMVVVLIYPARQITDGIWILYPLWALASLELSRYLFNRSNHWITSLSQALFIFTLIVLLWLTLIGTLHTPADPQAGYLRLGVMAGVAALGGLTTILVAYGWSWADARRGLVWGVCTAFGIYILANLWSVYQVESLGERLIRHNLWAPWPQSGQAELMRETLGNLSEWNTGRRDAIDVTVAVESPSVYWILRDFPNAKAVPEGDYSSTEAIPSIVITRQQAQEPRLGALYRGQDFSWWINPAWEGAAPPDFIRWLAFRQVPVRNESLILWARGDLFPGGTLSPPEATSENDTPSDGDLSGEGISPD